MSFYVFLLALLSPSGSLSFCKPFRLGCITPNLRHLNFTHLSQFSYHLSFTSTQPQLPLQPMAADWSSRKQGTFPWNQNLIQPWWTALCRYLLPSSEPAIISLGWRDRHLGVPSLGATNPSLSMLIAACPMVKRQQRNICLLQNSLTFSVKWQHENSK